MDNPYYDWAAIVADEKIELPKDAVPYSSPEVGDSLNWLTDTFAKAVTGSEELGEQGKKGWLYVEKDIDGRWQMDHASPEGRHELIDEIAPGGAGFPFQGGVWVAVNSTAQGIACTFGTVSRAGRGETVHPGAVAGTERAKTSTSGRCQAGRLLICGT